MRHLRNGTVLKLEGLIVRIDFKLYFYYWLETMPRETAKLKRIFAYLDYRANLWDFAKRLDFSVLSIVKCLDELHQMEGYCFHQSKIVLFVKYTASKPKLALLLCSFSCFYLPLSVFFSIPPNIFIFSRSSIVFFLYHTIIISYPKYKQPIKSIHIGSIG